MVHEGYDVCLYQTLAGVCREAVATELCLDNSTEDEPQPCTVAEVCKALKQEGSVSLYPLKGGDWKYRIQKHAGFWDAPRRPVNQSKRSKGGK
jgi:hypothetical protein